MFRHILLLLFINESYHILGNPIKPSSSVSLIDSLTVLAKSCEVEFISKSILKFISPCSDVSATNGDKQLQCMVFYDINKQLCAAVDSPNLALSPNITSKITEEQDITLLCDTAKDWVFTNLTEFPRYKQRVDKLFKNPVTCGKICGVEDFMSDDANIFCKYFKWGTDLLKMQVSTVHTQGDVTNNAEVPSNSAADIINPNPSASHSNDLQDVQVKSSTNISKSHSLNASAVINSIAVPEAVLKVETSSAMVAKNVQPENNVLPENNQPNQAHEDSIPKIDILQEDLTKIDTSVDTHDDQDEPQETNLEKAAQNLIKELESKDHPVLEKTKIKPVEIEDYQDTDEGKDGLSDTQGGDDGEEPIGEDSLLVNKPEEPKPVKKTDTVVTTFNVEKEYYPNPDEDRFSDEDDHFFPFFLTAIILAVLLYVLYHNKNKVGKVFFGLILEGRQNGRRRDSRGHAYRRLDTLEQAMSANSAAPPSKIIY